MYIPQNLQFLGGEETQLSSSPAGRALRDSVEQSRMELPTVPKAPDADLGLNDPKSFFFFLFFLKKLTFFRVCELRRLE